MVFISGIKGPLFGYFLQPTKTFSVVNEPFVSYSKNIFLETVSNVVCSRRLLGGIEMIKRLC